MKISRARRIAIYVDECTRLTRPRDRLALQGNFHPASVRAEFRLVATSSPA